MRADQQKPLDAIELAAEHGMSEDMASKIPLRRRDECPAERSSRFELRHELLNRPSADGEKRVRRLPTVRTALRNCSDQRLIPALPMAVP